MSSPSVRMLLAYAGAPSRAVALVVVEAEVEEAPRASPTVLKGPIHGQMGSGPGPSIISRALPSVAPAKRPQLQSPQANCSSPPPTFSSIELDADADTLAECDDSKQRLPVMIKANPISQPLYGGILDDYRRGTACVLALTKSSRQRCHR